MTVKDLVAAVENAPNIHALAYALNELQSYTEGRRSGDIYAYVDIDALQSFGGEEPPTSMDGLIIYSWDAESLLFMDGMWNVYPRDELEEDA